MYLYLLYLYCFICFLIFPFLILKKEEWDKLSRCIFFLVHYIFTTYYALLQNLSFYSKNKLKIKIIKNKKKKVLLFHTRSLISSSLQTFFFCLLLFIAVWGLCFKAQSYLHTHTYGTFHVERTKKNTKKKTICFGRLSLAGV